MNTQDEIRALNDRLKSLEYDFNKLKHAILYLPEIGDKVQKGMWS